MTDPTAHPSDSALDRAAAAAPMHWEDENAGDASASNQEAAAAHDSPAAADAARATAFGEDGAGSSTTSIDDADGHDHMSSIYGPPAELREERTGE